MDDQKLANWANVAKVVGAVIALVVFFLGSGFVYNEFWSVPDLRYTVLPTYAVGEIHFSGLVLENRGRAAAKGILLKISELDAPIEALEVQSDELFAVREGGEGEANVAVWLDRLTKGASITMYLLSEEDLKIENSLAIVSDDGLARLAAEGGVSLIGFSIANVAGVITGIAAVYLVLSLIWRILGLRPVWKAPTLTFEWRDQTSTALNEEEDDE